MDVIGNPALFAVSAFPLYPWIPWINTVYDGFCYKSATRNPPLKGLPRESWTSGEDAAGCLHVDRFHAKHCVVDAGADDRAEMTDELMGAVGRLLRRG